MGSQHVTKVVWRSRIVLLSAAGKHPPEISAAAGKSELVERFVGRITEDRIRCGVFKSVAQPERAFKRAFGEGLAAPG